MYCRKCGAEVAEGAEFCGNCGERVAEVESIEGQPEEGVGALGIVLFCLPIVGAIMYFVWKDEKPRKAQMACYLALGGLALGILLQTVATLAGE